MSFNSKLSEYLKLFTEQGEEQQVDATAPAPQQAPPPTPPTAQKEEPSALPPEGYVDMVRMLAKALVMNIPAGTIDALFTKPINQESAVEAREALQQSIASNENYEDNPQRITNPHVKKFVDSINENNFMAKYKEILNIMKRYSNDPNLK